MSLSLAAVCLGASGTVFGFQSIVFSLEQMLRYEMQETTWIQRSDIANSVWSGDARLWVFQRACGLPVCWGTLAPISFCMCLLCMDHGVSQTHWRHSRGLSIDKTCLSEIQALFISSQYTDPLEECLWHSLGATLELCGVCCHPTWVSDFCYRTGPRSYSNASQWWSYLRASCIRFTRMWLS